jgi:hypothetical protein
MTSSEANNNAEAERLPLLRELTTLLKPEPGSSYFASDRTVSWGILIPDPPKARFQQSSTKDSPSP